MTMTQQVQHDGTLSQTKYGVPIDRSFGEPASEGQIQRAAESLKKNGFAVQIVDTPADARSYVNSILPHDEVIFTASSETVRLSGLDQDINASGKFKSLRQQLAKMGPKTQFLEQVKLGATCDVIVGSVHAITEMGHVVVGSASGSQSRSLCRFGRKGNLDCGRPESCARH